MGVAPNGWLRRENPIQKWMMTGGTTILGNLQMGMQRLILRSFSLRSGYSHDSNDRFITKSGALVLSNESNVVVYQEYDKPAIEDGWFILHTHTEIWVYIYKHIYCTVISHS